MAFMAEYNRRYGIQNKKSQHIALAPLEEFLQPEWPEFVKKKFKHWLDTNHNAVKFYSKDQLCIIFYEELLLNIAKAIKPCLKFLGYNEIPSKIEKCLISNQEGQFHRPQRPPEEIEIIIKQIPTHILDEMEHQKNISMQNVLKNSIHTHYGKFLYS